MSESTGPRFSKFEMGDLNEQQKRVAERIMKVSSAGLGGPYSILLRSPVLAERYLGMTDYLRFETSLPHRLNELAILQFDLRIRPTAKALLPRERVVSKVENHKAKAQGLESGGHGLKLGLFWLREGEDGSPGAALNNPYSALIRERPA